MKMRKPSKDEKGEPCCEDVLKEAIHMINLKIDCFHDECKIGSEGACVIHFYERSCSVAKLKALIKKMKQ